LKRESERDLVMVSERGEAPLPKNHLPLSAGEGVHPEGFSLKGLRR